MTEKAVYDTWLAQIYEYSPFFARNVEESVDFYTKTVLETGDPVLEVGSATGQYTLALARAGLNITALDISSCMLAVIKSKLANEPPEISDRVSLCEGDMRTFRLNRLFRTVILPGNILLASLSLEDQIRTLKNAARHLEPGGYLALDVFCPDRKLISECHEHSWTQFTLPESSEVIFSERFTTVDPFQQRLLIRFVDEVVNDSGLLSCRRMSTIEFRYIYPWELVLMLNLAGFSVKRFLGDFRSPQAKSRYDGRQIIVAQKLNKGRG